MIFVPREELEIITRSIDQVVVDPLRRGPAKLIDRANQALREFSNRKISHRAFSTGRILPSGDILLQTDSLEDVVQLSRTTSWCTTFGETAGLRQRTYQVVMEGVDTSMGLENLPAQIKANNRRRLAATHTQTIWTGWLLGSRRATGTP
ncbi:hypothetical protein BJX99DRAFT_259176 [Aspergillus californicus]